MRFRWCGPRSIDFTFRVADADGDICPRLLRQARRLQRLAVIEIATDARDLPAAKLEEHSQRRIDLNAAAPPTSLCATEHEHAVAEIAEVFSNRAELLPRVRNRTEERFQAIAFPKAATVESREQGRNQLEVVGRALDERRGITPV